MYTIRKEAREKKKREGKKYGEQSRYREFYDENKASYSASDFDEILLRKPVKTRGPAQERFVSQPVRE